jgi:WD40 repeat protein
MPVRRPEYRRNVPRNRAPYLVATAACVIAVAGCGGSHKVEGINPATTPLKAEKAKKIAAIQKTKEAVAAVATTHVVARHSGCEDATFATWSPDGRQIAWPGRTSICVANANGSNAHRLLHTRGTVDSPTQLFWIKPGLMLYGDNYTISRIPIGAKPQIFKGIQAPAFSVTADGSRFATSTQSDCPGCTGPAHVWTLRGAEVGAIGSAKAYNDPPSLSPDGKHAVYAVGGGIWTAAADGSSAHELVSRATAPLWSPAGGEIAYSNSQGLWIVGTNGGTSRLLSRDISAKAGWSPNGKLIASWSIGKLVVVDVATGKARRLPFVGYPSGNDWSPDSKELLVTARLSGRCFALWRVPVNGYNPRLLSSCF